MDFYFNIGHFYNNTFILFLIMGVTYQAILWNKQKKIYDVCILMFVLFVSLSSFVFYYLFNYEITFETFIIRTSALTALILLHFILIIGPLCRLNPVFLPFLYNRRHLGVTMFLFALIHGIFCIIQFHSLGDTHPILSVFLSNKKYNTISLFPFQTLGFFALIILFLMASTSHDFWLHNLSPTIWKTLHMLVYIAYLLIILHIALGILQFENKLIFWIVLISSFLFVCSIHLLAAFYEYRWLILQKKFLTLNGFVEICNVEDVQNNGGKSFFIDNQNIAIFNYNNSISAVNNVCKHQMGPLAEGRIIDGCITCPWHGYQYLPQNGQAPPPFKEKLTTYKIKIIKNKIWVNPTPNEAGVFIEPAKI